MTTTPAEPGVTPGTDPTQPPPDASVVDILIADHRRTEQLFQAYVAGTPDGGDVESLVRRMIVELVQHAEAEEQYVYPAARDVFATGDRLIEHEISEHSRVEELMNALDGMSPAEPTYDGYVRRLITTVRDHVSEEESITLPLLRNALPESDLLALAGKVLRAKRMSPTHPHPLAPDHPPFNKVLGAGPALVDRVRDWLRDATDSTDEGTRS